MKRLISGLAALVVASALSFAAYTPIPLLTTPATNEPGQINSTLNGIINSLNSNVNPANFAPAASPRNLLDNGAMAISQRGTGTVTCAVAAGLASANYTADRWGCSGNVTSGQGQAAVITASPAPPTGFAQAVKVWRNSATLTQPICLIQEVPTQSAVAAQGQVVTLSAYIAGLAGLAADNGGVVNMTVITGTSADEGLGTMTATPAITPAWTGLASVATQAFTVTTAFSRVSVNAQIGATVKEIGVEICFTPTATGAGATDGFAVTGAQLEIGNTPSAFEFRSVAQELATAQRYFVQWTDNLAATYTLPGTCFETSSGATAACTLILPQTMRTTPTSVVATATSFGMTKVADGTAGACSTLAVISSSNTPNSIGLTCALSETATVGTGHRMIYANSGTNTLTVSADF
jgi:hypothetical protein